MKTTEVKELPKCDFCEESALYDAKTKEGCWAYMCLWHWKTQADSQTLGMGRGQELILINDTKKNI